MMLLDRETEQKLVEAEGYLLLSMNQDAWDVLDALPPEHKTANKVLRLRMHIALELERWELGATVARGH
ncbi:MAG: hypothetical protein ACI9DF_004541 [Verrucomicrobiales bacterium]|jgi:hypothetical protein